MPARGMLHEPVCLALLPACHAVDDEQVNAPRGDMPECTCCRLVTAGMLSAQASEFLADPVKVTIGSADLSASHSVSQVDSRV